MSAIERTYQSQMEYFKEAQLPGLSNWFKRRRIIAKHMGEYAKLLEIQSLGHDALKAALQQRGVHQLTDLCSGVARSPLSLAREGIITNLELVDDRYSLESELYNPDFLSVTRGFADKTLPSLQLDISGTLIQFKEDAKKHDHSILYPNGSLLFTGYSLARRFVTPDGTDGLIKKFGLNHCSDINPFGIQDIVYAASINGVKRLFITDTPYEEKTQADPDGLKKDLEEMTQWLGWKIIEWKWIEEVRTYLAVIEYEASQNTYTRNHNQGSIITHPFFYL